jgi:SAM-dependent methyltransferase
MSDERRDVATAWDREYAAGRYAGDPPVPFVRDIIASAIRAEVLDRPGVDIGCGNGRNYVALVDGGLDLIGLDVSEAAVRQLAVRVPDRASRLIHGDITSLPSGATYGAVVGLQVFQHGDRATCHAHVLAAQELLEPGGVMAVRVNAVGTDIEFDHEVVEEEEEEGSGLTVRYLEGPKRGLLVHFFDRPELEGLFIDRFDADLPMRCDRTRRPRPGAGQWMQWEAIWVRRREVAGT